jgi:hypothetical protein
MEIKMIHLLILKAHIWARHQWLMSVILAIWEAEISRIMVWSQPRQTVSETLTGKYPTPKKAGRVAQVVEHLPRKCEALNSNPSTAKKKKKAYILIHVWKCFHNFDFWKKHHPIIQILKSVLLGMFIPQNAVNFTKCKIDSHLCQHQMKYWMGNQKLCFVQFWTFIVFLD